MGDGQQSVGLLLQGINPIGRPMVSVTVPFKNVGRIRNGMEETNGLVSGRLRVGDCYLSQVGTSVVKD